MQRALLATAAAAILAAASITPASAQRDGGRGGGSPGVAHSAPSGGGGGAFRGGGGGSPGGVARSGPSFSGGGSTFRSGGGTQFGGSAGMPSRGGNMGNVHALRGQFGGTTQFHAVPSQRNFAQAPRFRHSRSIVRFGAPYFYDDYGYYPYSSYSVDDECYDTRRVWTNAGWRYVQVYVCDE